MLADNRASAYSKENMGLQQISDTEYLFEQGPLGVHEHPRFFDGVVYDPDNPETPEIDESRVGKAGVDAFTRVALYSGFSAIIAMSNESLRIPGLSVEELEANGGVNNYNRTHIVPFPLSNLDRLLPAANVIGTQSNLPTSINLGIDPKDFHPDAAKIEIDHRSLNDRRRAREFVEPITARFVETKDLVTGAKGFLDLSTGGYMINPYLAPYLIEAFHETNYGKPFTTHVEGSGVFNLLSAVNEIGGAAWPIHVAHVSSQEELEAVIWAKQAGMNVTTEVTLHHIFLTDEHSERPDGLGCMKPSLKTWKDVLFLRKHFKEYIDCIGNDCAPHSYSDKQNGTFGITNHPSVLNMFMGAAFDPAEDWIEPDDVYKKLSVNTYKRFNYPYLGGQVVFNRAIDPLPNTEYAATDPFAGNYRWSGGVSDAISGTGSTFHRYSDDSEPFKGQKTYSNFISPRSIEL